MIAGTLGAIIIGWLPGAVFFRVPWLDRDRRAALPADERLFWAIILSLGWSLSLVLVLGLAGRYRFDRLLLLNLLVSGATILLCRTSLGYGGRATRMSPQAALPALLVALGCWLYFPPSEYIIGGRDPGIYLNEGIQIAQRGSLLIEDPTISSVPPGQRDLFFPSHQRSTYYGTRFMGFFVQDPTAGTVVGQFPHLFPASIAVGYGLNGLTGARQAVAVWAVLGVLAVYFAGTRIIGPVPAAAAAFLLASNVIEVWFGRYPNAEVVAQTLLFSALLAFGRAWDGDYRFFGPLAGALLGLQLFLRFDTAIAIVAVSAAATLAPFARRRVGWGFAIALISTIGAALVYLLGPMRAYAELPLLATADRGGWWIVASAVLLIAGVRLLSRSAAWAERVRIAAPVGLVLVVSLLAIYAYFFRSPGGRTAAFDAYAFRNFTWYLTPWGMAGGVIGFLLLARRAFWRDPAFFFTVTAYSIFFFYKMRIVPEHFWSTRRFLAATLPGLILGLGGLAALLLRSGITRETPATGNADETLARSSRTARLLGSAAVCLLFAALGAMFWRAAAPVRAHVEYAGLIPRLEALAARFGDRDLLLVESRNASDVHVLALPLAYIYDRHVLVLNSPRPAKPEFAAFMTWAQTNYANVFYLGGGGTDLLTASLVAEPVASERFQIPEYAAPVDTYPTGVQRKEFDYGVYRLVLASPAAAGPITLRIGILDDLQVTAFHAKERRDDGVPFRWSRSRSYVLLPNLGGDAREVTIWMSSGGRPATAARPDVTVSLDDQVLGTVTPVDALQPYTFALPRTLAATPAIRQEPARLRIEVPTWNPHTTLGGGDTRDLGVMVTSVEAR